jgi:hypothetical protein
MPGYDGFPSHVMPASWSQSAAGITAKNVETKVVPAMWMNRQHRVPGDTVLRDTGDLRSVLVIGVRPNFSNLCLVMII